jgi:hypothetical protein
VTTPEPREPAAGAPSYWLTRFVFLRLLGLVYAVAFLIVVNQWLPLLGRHGLLPAADFLDAVGQAWGRDVGSYLRLPTAFWWGACDTVFRVAGLLGFALSLLVLLGLANVPIPLVLSWWLPSSCSGPAGRASWPGA